MRGRFNLFQAAMLRWRTLHPYNAVHAVALRAPLDAQRLQQAIDEVLSSRGLTGFALDPQRKRYHWSGGPANAGLAIVAGGADPRRALDAVFEDRLNAVFPAGGSYEPLRFFAVTGAQEFQLGVA